MTRSVYSAPPACIEPHLGALATQALGRTPSPRVAGHLVSCRACLLQHAVFDALESQAAPPPSDLRSRLWERVEPLLAARAPR